jgi:hypothetical protein
VRAPQAGKELSPVHIFLLAVALLFPQQQDDLSIIEGQVLDRSTNAPIPGARVIAARIDKPGTAIGPGLLDIKPAEGEQDPKAERAAVLTGSDGKFRIRFQGEVRCVLFADAPGYVRPQTGIGPDNTFTAKPGSPKPDIVLRLSHEVSISGRVLDAETDQPAPGLMVRTLSNRAASAGHFLLPGRSAKTDDQGRFKIESVAPGEYYLEVGPPLAATLSKVRPLEAFRNDQEKSCVKSWYPDANSVEQALTVRVAEGAPIDGLTIRAARRKTGSIRGRVLGDVPGEEAHLDLTAVERSLTGQGFSSVRGGKIKVGEEFEMDHLSPCSGYLIAAVIGDHPKYAKVSVVIGEDNQEGLDLYLRPAMSLSGRVRIEGREERPDQPVLPSDSVRVSLRPVVLLSALNSDAPALVNPQDGLFTVGGMVTDRYRVNVTGAPPGYAVSEVRYNGRVCPFSMVPFEATAAQQSLEVRLAQAGSIVATVTDGSNPLPNSILLMAPEGADPEVLYLGYELKQATASRQGRASFANLKPGVYRLVAYTPGTPWADDPDFRRHLMNGERVEVSANQQQPIELRARSLR